jgi:hypothetical protein
VWDGKVTATCARHQPTCIQAYSRTENRLAGGALLEELYATLPLRPMVRCMAVICEHLLRPERTSPLEQSKRISGTLTYPFCCMSGHKSVVVDNGAKVRCTGHLVGRWHPERASGRSAISARTYVCQKTNDQVYCVCNSALYPRDHRQAACMTTLDLLQLSQSCLAGSHTQWHRSKHGQCSHVHILLGLMVCSNCQYQESATNSAQNTMPRCALAAGVTTNGMAYVTRS